MRSNCNNFRALFRYPGKYAGQGYILNKLKYPQFPDNHNGIYVSNKPLDSEDAAAYYQEELSDGRYLLRVGPEARTAQVNMQEALHPVVGPERTIPTWDSTGETWLYQHRDMLGTTTRDTSYTPRHPRAIPGFQDDAAFVPPSADGTTGWTQYHIVVTVETWERAQRLFMNIPYTVSDHDDGQVYVTFLLRNRRRKNMSELRTEGITVVKSLAGQLMTALCIKPDDELARELYQQWVGQQSQVFGRHYPDVDQDMGGGMKPLDVVKSLVVDESMLITEALGRLAI